MTTGNAQPAIIQEGCVLSFPLTGRLGFFIRPSVHFLQKFIRSSRPAGRTVFMTPIFDFIHQTSYADLPETVQNQAVRCVLDLCGSLIGGRQTRLSKIIRDHVCLAFGGDQATILLDGRRCSAPGAALANGMTIDSLDIHDSHRESLGHAGAHIFPTLLAVNELNCSEGRALVSGPEFLAAVVVGYEIACRAGMALHATVSDYHTSGAWGAVSSAALYSRLRRLDTNRTRHAVGIAEYHGPRSQMMRVIDTPTMLKDGSGWGAMAGVSAGMLAESGFTGAPAITLESADVADWWADLGARWITLEQGFKTHAVCWWAQPAIEAVLGIARRMGPDVDAIHAIRVETFEKATRLSHPRPESTEEAQYSLPYPVAAALRCWADRGDDGWYGVGPGQLLEANLSDPRVLELAEKIELVSDPDLTARFPEKFLARAVIEMNDGTELASPEMTFRGEMDDPLTDEELLAKFRWLAGGILPPDRVDAIEKAVFALPTAKSIEPLLDELVEGVD